MEPAGGIEQQCEHILCIDFPAVHSKVHSNVLWQQGWMPLCPELVLFIAKANCCAGLQPCSPGAAVHFITVVFIQCLVRWAACFLAALGTL